MHCLFVSMMSVFFDVSCEPRLVYDYNLKMTVVNGQPKCELPVGLRAAIDEAMIRRDMHRRAVAYDKIKSQKNALFPPIK